MDFKKGDHVRFEKDGKQVAAVVDHVNLGSVLLVVEGDPVRYSVSSEKVRKG